MPRHDVRFTIPERRLGNADIEFAVYSDEQRLGLLQVSKGALVWRPANKKRGFLVGWSRFDQIMRGERRERRARAAV